MPEDKYQFSAPRNQGLAGGPSTKPRSLILLHFSPAAYDRTEQVGGKSLACRTRMDSTISFDNEMKIQETSRTCNSSNTCGFSSSLVILYRMPQSNA